MKRIILSLIIFTLLIGSCSKSKNERHLGFGELLYMSGLQISNIFIKTTYSPTKKKEPGTVVGDFLLALSDGECEEAIKSTTGRAQELVQSAIDAGCEPYKTIIRSMECKINETRDSAVCACEEDRDGMSMTYVYDLELIKRKWKIENYQKDLNSSDLDIKEGEE